MFVFDDTGDMNIEHISVSRTNVWNHCQQQYKFKYHLKIESPEPEKPYFLYGKLVHRIAEEYVLAKGKRDLNDIRKEFLEGVTPVEPSYEGVVPKDILPKEYLGKLPRHLKAFMKVTRYLGMDGDCEWGFKYSLDESNQKFVKGFLDRLIFKNGRYIIVDYKTTKKGPWRRTKKDVATDLQLQCYAMVVMNELNVDPNKIYAGLYYLEGEEFIGASFSRKTLDKAKETLLKVYNQIHESDPDKVLGRTGNHCYRCEYHSMCPFFSLT